MAQVCFRYVFAYRRVGVRYRELVSAYNFYLCGHATQGIACVGLWYMGLSVVGLCAGIPGLVRAEGANRV